MTAGLGALLLAAAVVLLVAQRRLVVGDPLPHVAQATALEKADPPKLRIEGDPIKPAGYDFVEEAAPVDVAPPTDPVVQALAERMTRALSRAGDVGESAIYVMDAAGRVVFDLGGAAPLIPASTAKLVTAAAALATFGPEHTFTTTLGATAAPTAAGVIRGDLVLTGGGDPTLVSEAFVQANVDNERLQTPIGALADQVVAAGVTSIDGRILGDGGYLQGSELAEGWTQRYLDEFDAAPISGLSIDLGIQLYTDDGGTLRSRPSPDTAADTAAALHTALVQRGVSIAGQPSSVLGVAPPVVAPLGQLESPPMTTMLTRMVQESDNHLADTIFRAIGRRAEGAGSFDEAEVQVVGVLNDLALDWSTTELSDGSGLSRTSRIPPALLTILNYRMTNSGAGQVWQDLMAVAGVSGTLERRLLDTIAELRLRGKTGTLEDVRAISGAVVGPDGRPLFFTVTSNSLQQDQRTNARRLQDLVILELAAELYQCTELTVPATTPETTTATAPTPPASPELPTYTCAS